MHDLLREDALPCRVGSIDLDSGRRPVSGTMMVLYIPISQIPPSSDCINLNLANAARADRSRPLSVALTAKLPGEKAA